MCCASILKCSVRLSIITKRNLKAWITWQNMSSCLRDCRWHHNNNVLQFTRWPYNVSFIMCTRAYNGSRLQTLIKLVWIQHWIKWRDDWFSHPHPRFSSYLKSKAKSIDERCIKRHGRGESLHCLLEDLGALHHTFLFISASSTSNGFPHRRRWNARYVIRVHLPSVGIDPLSSV